MSSDTSANNKRIAKNTLLLYFRMLITMAVSLYTSRVVLAVLGVDDYGIYNVVGGVITMLGFITGSLGGASSRYITFALGKGDKKEQETIFGNILSIHTLLALLVLVVGETVGLWFVSTQLNIPPEREIAAFWVYQASIVSSALAIFSSPYNAALIAHERMSIFAYISIVDAFFKLLIVYVLTIVPYDKLIIYAFLVLIIQVLNTAVYLTYSFRHFGETQTSFKYTPQFFREIFAYAGWIMNGHLAVVGYTQGLNILLNIFFNPAVNAARAIAVQVQGVCQQFCSSFQLAVRPQLIKSYAQGEMSNMHNLLIRSSKFSFYILFFIVLPLMFEAEIVLEVWLGIVPEHVVAFLRLILFSGLLFTLSNPIITSVHATGSLRKFQLIEGTMLLSIVPIAYLLLKFFNVPPESVFCVHIVVEMLTQYARVRIVLPMINMNCRRYVNEVVKPIAIVALLSPVVPFIVWQLMPNGYIAFFVVCAVCILCNALLMLTIGCTPNERQFFIEKLKHFIRRF